MNKEQLTKKIAAPDIQYWPEVRWWLPGGLNTDVTLRREVRNLYAKGFGATEFLALPDYGAPNERYGWGSEEWIHDSRVIIEEGTKLGMGASMTSGANWSNANLTTITPDDRAASKELDFTCRLLEPGETYDGPLEKFDFGGGLDINPEAAALLELQNQVSIKTHVRDYGLTGKAEIVFR